MERQFNIFEAIYLSFYSKRLYREVATTWGGYAILYLLMIVTLSWIAMTWQFQTIISEGYKNNNGWIVSQVPVMTVKDGKISTPSHKPYIITEPGTQNKIAIIDTTGKYKSLEEAGTGILVTEDKIITSNSNNETRIYNISQKTNVTVDPFIVNGYINKIVGYAWIPMFICFVLMSFFYRLVQAFIYAVLGKIFNYFYDTELTYGQIALIAMIAVTPAIILDILLGAAAIHFNGQYTLYFILTMFYLCYGLAANKPGK